MAAYRLLIKRSAVKELEAVPIPDRARIVERIRRLSDHPRLPGGEKLSGEDKYRIREGDYRIVYLIDDKAREVTIFKIGHRRELYRRSK